MIFLSIFLISFFFDFGINLLIMGQLVILIAVLVLTKIIINNLHEMHSFNDISKTIIKIKNFNIVICLLLSIRILYNLIHVWGFHSNCVDPIVYFLFRFCWFAKVDRIFSRYNKVITNNFWIKKLILNNSCLFEF